MALTTLSSNPRYFTANGTDAVYLTGPHNWYVMTNGEGPNEDTNYITYLNMMQSYGHNFLRLWMNIDSGETYFTPTYYNRTGPGNALDGDLKFDLSSLNTAYTTKLTNILDSAAAKDIYVSLMLFEGWWLADAEAKPVVWARHPFNPSNNTTGFAINVDDVHDLSNATAIGHQKDFIEKIIDTVNAYDNILYELANEDAGGTTAFQIYFYNHISTYQSGKAKQHPIGLTTRAFGTDDNWLYINSADWVSPGPATYFGDPNDPMKVDPPVTDGGEVVILDTDHLWGIGGNQQWVWKSFLRGYNPIYMGDNINDDTTILYAMGRTKTYADKMDLKSMTPQNALSSTTYCLAKTGAEYLFYQPGSGSFNITMENNAYDYEWYNPSTGSVVQSGTETFSGTVNVVPPFSGDAVFYLTVVEPTVLTSGVPIAGSVAHNQWSYYRIDADASDTQLMVELTGLSNDVDLYVRAGSLPTTVAYDCRPYLSGTSSETCTLPNTSLTTWYIGVHGYQAGSYTIEATLSGPAGGPYYVTQNGEGSKNGTSGNAWDVNQFNALTGTGYAGSTFYFSGTITTAMDVNISGTSGNYVTLDGYEAGDYDPINTPMGTHCEISITSESGFKIDGENYITIQDFEFDGNGTVYDPVLVYGASTYIKFRRCHFHDALWRALLITYTGGNCSYVTIGGASGDGCSFEDNSNGHVAGAAMEGANVSHIVVSYNKFFYSGAGNLGHTGPQFENCNYLLFEYNVSFDHITEGAVATKDTDNAIIRFNRLSSSGDFGICLCFDDDHNAGTNTYIYSNKIYDNGTYGILMMAGANNVNVWSNIIYDNDDTGIAISDYYGSCNDIYIYNNTIVDNADGQNEEPEPGFDLGGIHISGTHTGDRLIRNNIFYGNYNTEVYNSSGWTVSDNCTAVIGDFTNYASDIFTLSGTSNAKDTGVDLSGLAGSLTIHGTTYNMYYDDCLDDSYVDFTTTPPTVRTVKQDDYGSWEKGAYVYAADAYYVTQNGEGLKDGTSGNAWDVNQFNVLTGTGYAGSTFYFSGTITSEIIVGVDGTSGSPVVLDGYETDNTTYQNCSEAPGRAKVDRGGGTNGIQMSSKDYITIQDFEITNCEEGILYWKQSTNITIKRCYIHTITTRGVFGSTDYAGNNSYITVGGSVGNGNVFKNIGNTTAGYDIKIAYTNHAIVSYNHCYADDTNYGITGVSWEGDGTYVHGDFLIEYNESHDHNCIYGGENGIGGKAGTNIIIRFNHVYNHIDVDGAGIVPGGNWSNIYIYGNSVHNNSINIYPYDGPNGTPDYYYNDCGDGVSPTGLYIWGNLIYESEEWSGILVGSTTCTGTDNPPDNISNVFIYNNVIAENATAAINSEETGIHLRGNITDATIKNNIFYKNRPNEVDYKQIHRGTDDVNSVTLDYNRYYWPGHTSRTFWSGTTYDSTSVPSQETHGTNGDPGFTNAGTNDYTLAAGSTCIDNGVDLSALAGSLTIHGTTYNMYYDDCLNPNNTDWTTVPHTVETLKQDEYGTGWDQGAYVYSGITNHPPDGSIDIPATNPTINTGDTVSFEGSYTDQDNDICTFDWSFETNSLDAWNNTDTYPIGRLLIHNDVYYKCIIENTNNQPPNVTYWTANAQTLSNPGSAKYSTAGVYSASLTVNDGSINDPDPPKRTIIVSGSTTKIWTHNTGYDYNTDGVTYINGQTTACSDTPTTSQTIQNAHDVVVCFSQSQYYWGALVEKSGGYTNLCRVDMMLSALGGDVTTNTYYVEVWSRTGNNLDTLLGSSSLQGATWNASWVSFQFSPTIASVPAGSIITISSHEYTDTTNYIGVHYDDVSNSAIDLPGLYTYNDSKSYQGGYPNDDFAIKVYEADTSLADTNYGSELSIYAKNSVSDDNQKIAYLADLSVLSGRTITNANLELWLETAPGTNINVEIWSCSDNFTELGATWNNYDGSNIWTGTHGQATFLGELGFTSSSSTGQYYSFTSNDFISYIASKAGSTAYFILYSDTNDTSAIAFTSNEGLDNNRPKLTINYSSQGGIIVGVNNTDSNTTGNGVYSTENEIIKFAIVANTGLQIVTDPNYPRIEMIINYTNIVYATYIGLGDATNTMIMGITLAAGMRHQDLNFTGSLDLGPGGSIIDQNGDPININMNGLSLADISDIKLAVPYQENNPKEFDSINTLSLWYVAGNYPVENDFFKWTENSTDSFDISLYNGTLGNEINLNGGGYEIIGNQKIGDYYIIKNFIFKQG